MKLGAYQAMIINEDKSCTTYEFSNYSSMRTFIKNHAHLKPIQIRRKRMLPNLDLFSEFVAMSKNINQALNRGEMI